MQVLYRKYRSRSLDELVGQDHIRDALKSAVKVGRVAHAYLFTGPRGTGKTSVARILAHMVNGIKYDESATQLDIIEIDAASNRKIDEIRDLREKVNIAPALLKYKVYIIDEVHMLTREAFNALLKTLEEPPEHVIFILATTELHKVPETIISRTQRFSFRPIEKSDLIKHLQFIANQESITIDDDALAMIADHAEGGFRDAISLLDQLRRVEDTITTDNVTEMLGMPPKKTIEKLWHLIKKGESEAAELLGNLYDQGYQPSLIAKALTEYAINDAKPALARKLLNAQSSYDPKIELLLTVIECQDSTNKATPSPKVAISAEPVNLKPSKQDLVTEEQKNTDNTPKEPPMKPKIDTPTNQPDDLWQNALNVIKEAGHAIYGPLRLAEAEIKGSDVRLKLAFPFHIKRISEKNNLSIISNTFKDLTGKEHQIIIEKIDKSEAKTIKKPSVASEIAKDPDSELMSDPLSIVRNVFGSAEVL